MGPIDCFNWLHQSLTFTSRQVVWMHLAYANDWCLAKYIELFKNYDYLVKLEAIRCD
jgi:hypothetical protein